MKKENWTFKDIQNKLRDLGIAELFRLEIAIQKELHRRKLRLIALNRINKE